MMKSKHLLIGAVITSGLAVAGPGLAQTGTASTGNLTTGNGAGTSQPRRAQNDPNRRVCRMVLPTGSRMGERVCRTQAEWDQRTEHAQRILSEEQLNHGGRDGEGPLSVSQSGANAPR